MNTNQSRDEQLWHLARKRADFKKHAASYFFVNSFLVAIWFFTSGIGSYFWPVWPMLGWGLGLAIQYFDAYNGNKLFTAEEEYQKLKNQQNQ
ncbi:2TM domain-containing protein [Foetidibacter luteolus]|uniref:2TM domain-containing protein n=1 Tax=Foetidibacter luteolus TaxID=2608880 RepID=UPI00129BF1CA|nr:2TM domain-containing protein [Foetidibacter luteolus]